jgi:hypothetical protein
VNSREKQSQMCQYLMIGITIPGIHTPQELP